MEKLQAKTEDALELVLKNHTQIIDLLIVLKAKLSLRNRQPDPRIAERDRVICRLADEVGLTLSEVFTRLPEINPEWARCQNGSPLNVEAVKAAYQRAKSNRAEDEDLSRISDELDRIGLALRALVDARAQHIQFTENIIAGIRSDAP